MRIPAMPKLCLKFCVWTCVLLAALSPTAFAQLNANAVKAPPLAALSQIRFDLKKIGFRLEGDETPGKNAPATMLGGLAIFDYDGDGKPDIYFTNGADIATLKKSDPKYRNRLFHNEGHGVFTDRTAEAGLAGSGYDIGVAVADYDNDGRPDVFVAGVYGNTLFHNNGNGTFTDMTAKAGLDHHNDPQYGPLWSVAAVWVDVNNDGLLDLFVVNYLQWAYSDKPLCSFGGVADYCHPRYYKGQPNQLFLNMGNGRFEDVSKAWGVRDRVGKGMGVGMADYDLDGKQDLFVTNDASYNSLFHNTGTKFEEVAFQSGVALTEDGSFISGMGLDFRDFNNDGYPDIVFVALDNQTFPFFENMGKGTFYEVTSETGMRELSMKMSGFGAALFDFDNDGWKDLFVSRGHVESQPLPGTEIAQWNTVFRNPGARGKWTALTKEAGFAAVPPERHRGCAFADLNGDGRIDVVATAINADAEIWINRTESPGHWLDIALEGTKSNRDGIGARVEVVSATAGAQYNHMTTSTGYASSSDGPVHFGLGGDNQAQSVKIDWPSGAVQTFEHVSADRVFKVKEPSH